MLLVEDGHIVFSFFLFFASSKPWAQSRGMSAGIWRFGTEEADRARQGGLLCCFLASRAEDHSAPSAGGAQGRADHPSPGELRGGGGSEPEAEPPGGWEPANLRSPPSQDQGQVSPGRKRSESQQYHFQLHSERQRINVWRDLLWLSS